MSDNNYTIKDLENRYQKLQSYLGDSYIKMKHNKTILESINKKEKIKSIIVKETNSKITTMLSRIKTLQNELKLLKDNESSVNSQVSITSKKVILYQEKMRVSPMLTLGKSTPDSRSHSVKPHFHSPFIANYY